MSLYVRQSGSTTAPTIVFLHGSGVSGWMWDEQIKVLQNDYQCLAIDLPGSGESYQTEWISLADTADQIAAIIRQSTASGKAHIVGLSLGGYTGLCLLEKYPTVVESLIVSGVSTRPFANLRRWQCTLGIMQRLMKWDV
ncbi:MAG: alpha/beta hydrolase, partial [Chloroflexota bacterium]